MPRYISSACIMSCSFSLMMQAIFGNVTIGRVAKHLVPFFPPGWYFLRCSGTGWQLLHRTHNWPRAPTPTAGIPRLPVPFTTFSERSFVWEERTEPRPTGLRTRTSGPTSTSPKRPTEEPTFPEDHRSRRQFTVPGSNPPVIWRLRGTLKTAAVTAWEGRATFPALEPGPANFTDPPRPCLPRNRSEKSGWCRNIRSSDRLSESKCRQINLF